MFSFVIDTEAGEKAAKEEAVVENTTPDYAAGLVSAQVLVYLCHTLETLLIPPLFIIKKFSKTYWPPGGPHIYLFSPPFSETGGVEREPSAINQLPTSHTQHGPLFLLHSQLRDATRLDETSGFFFFAQTLLLHPGLSTMLTYRY